MKRTVWERREKKAQAIKLVQHFGRVRVLLQDGEEKNTILYVMPLREPIPLASANLTGNHCVEDALVFAGVGL